MVGARRGKEERFSQRIENTPGSEQQLTDALGAGFLKTIKVAQTLACLAEGAGRLGVLTPERGHGVLGGGNAGVALGAESLGESSLLERYCIHRE